MPATIRRTLLHVETTLVDGGREAARPLKLIAAVAVIANPWAGRGFVDNLRPEIREVSPEVGRLLTDMTEAIRNVPECLACGYVDMSTGMLLAAKTVDSHPQEVLDLVASATADLFQGSSVVAIEDHFKKAHGREGDSPHYFQEIIVLSEMVIHVFIRTKKMPEHAVCFVSRKSANIGILLAKARMAVERLAAAV